MTPRLKERGVGVFSYIGEYLKYNSIMDVSTITLEAEKRTTRALPALYPPPD